MGRNFKLKYIRYYLDASYSKPQPACCGDGANTTYRLVLHRSIGFHNPNNLFILTINYRDNFTKMQFLTVRRMAMFVVKNIFVFKLIVELWIYELHSHAL